MSSEKLISETTTEGVLVLTLNDPGTRNALGQELMAELIAEARRFSESPQLRCLVLTGAGTAFCSGANMRDRARGVEEAERAEGGDAPVESVWEQLDPVYTKESRRFRGPEIVTLLYGLEKPSIAAVNGAAYGIGCGIALACDLRFASESARFSEAFVNAGFVSGDGSAWLLPKLIGMANTLWMQYTGDPVDAHEAYRIGLVNAVTSAADLRDKAMEMATRLATGPGVALSLVKHLVQQGYQQDLADNMRLAARAQAMARSTYDFKEGARAFAEKRPPRFEGR